MTPDTLLLINILCCFGPTFFAGGVGLFLIGGMHMSDPYSNRQAWGAFLCGVSVAWLLGTFNGIRNRASTDDLSKTYPTKTYPQCNPAPCPQRESKIEPDGWTPYNNALSL